MTALKLFSRRFNKTVLVIALTIVAAINIFVPSAIAQRPPMPYQITSSDWVSIGAGESGTLVWRCGDRYRYTVGGGFETEAISGNASTGFKVIHSHPEDSATWRLRLRNTDDVARNVKIYNVCALP
ncbi:hypothetical protein PN498_00920 [Oscillatoria sp. CS-180]|uniref:hypothetical protein n=1 Tax=Oscillatoria sp. CS-180 TaxID=3021720 RepID=UPI00232EE693|nr:hypothetical protein [Oscillatoria sp. CS-180]MDB9524535.1 hypothetical protein [Oscillatoria sp. CS-180]